MNLTKTTILSILLFISLFSFGQEEKSFLNCGFDDSKLKMLKINTENLKVREDGFYVCRIAIDIDYNTYEHFNFNKELVKYELNKMIHKVSLLYKAEVNTKLVVSEIHIWDSEIDDPYRGTIEISELLRILRANTQEANVFKKDYDVYMYLPVKKFSGAGGLASGQGNVSPWGGLQTIAHEIGHNFSSPHTQSCSWKNGPLDFCYPSEGSCYENTLENIEGTIMSYCSMSKVTFHPEVRNILNAHASQNLNFVNTTPEVPQLDSLVVNTFNVPFVSFAPIFEANEYIYEISNTPDFQNIIESDTIPFSSIYFKDYSKLTRYSIRVKAFNQFGTSDWSNTFEVSNESHLLSVPIPVSTFDRKYLDFATLNSNHLEFSRVANAEEYEIEVVTYNGLYSGEDRSFPREFKVNTNSLPLQEIVQNNQNDFKWRVRALNSNSKSAWSDFQFIFIQRNYLFSDFPLHQPLPVEFSISRNENYNALVSYYLTKIEGGNEYPVTEEKVTKEKYRYIFSNLEPNSNYKLKVDVSSKNHIIWEERKKGVQYSFEKSLTTSSESLPPEWELFTTGDSLMEYETYSVNFIQQFVFIITNRGLLKYNIETNEKQLYNHQNTNGNISNQIDYIDVDKDDNLWLIQKVSKRLSYSGFFPHAVYSAMKFGVEDMKLIQRIDFQLKDSGPILSFDANNLTVAGFNQIEKIKNDETVIIQDLSVLNESSSYWYTLGFKGNKYWTRGTPRNQNYMELASLDLTTGEVEKYNHMLYKNLPTTFTDVYFDSEGKPMIFNSQNKIVLKKEGNEFTPFANLTHPQGEIYYLSYHNGVFLARIGNFIENGIYKFYDDKWSLISKHPKYISNYYSYQLDNRGNPWLNSSYSFIRLDVCSEISAPKVVAESVIKYGDNTTIEVDGCSNTNWSYDGFSGEISESSINSKTFLPNKSFTYQISCTEGGCNSKNVEGELIVIPEIKINSIAKDSVCQGGEINLNSSMLGEYSDTNGFELILKGDIETHRLSAGSLTGPFKLNESIKADSYWLKLKTTNPESYSEDSIRLDVRARAEVKVLGDADICNGIPSNLRLEVSGNEPFEYSWTNNQNEVISAKDSFSINQTGEYQIIVTDANGCKSLSQSIVSKSINIAESIIVNGSSDLVPGQSVILEVRNNPKWSYEWTINGQPTSFGSVHYINASNPGIYTVEIKEGSCEYVTAEVEIKQILASKEENLKWEVKIAPNPVEKYLKITLPSHNTSLVSFKILSTEGKLLKSWQNSSKVQRIDISSLEAGLYYLKSQTDIETFTQKFIRN